MRYIKTTWKLLSALETPLQADTIFGHVCWAMRYISGEKKLKEFLDSYLKEPPLIISDGMPAGYLPVPLIPLQFDTDDWNKAQENKQLSKISFVKSDDLKKIRLDFKSDGLIKLLELTYAENKNKKNKPINEIISHNTINRFTNTAVKPGGFFQEEAEFFCGNEQNVMDVYFIINENMITKKELDNILVFIEQSGYGQNKSTGRGVFSITAKEDNGFFDKSDNYNAFVALSSFCPAKTDPTHGFWDLTVKFGRLGGDFAKYGIPYKRAVTMLKRGSVFLSDPVLPYYGRILDNVHQNRPEIKHYAMAMAYPIRFTEEELLCRA